MKMIDLPQNHNLIGMYGTADPNYSTWIMHFGNITAKITYE